MSSSFDVLVIGAGAGGMAAAGRLQALGYRTLLVERHDRVGGRASTREVDGFRIVNPGSPTDRRREPHGTLAVMRIGPERLGVEIVEVT